MSLSWDLTGQGLMVIGAVIFVAAALGLLRFPDVYTRSSAVATAAGLGVAFIVAGVVLRDPNLSEIVKGGVAIALQLATSVVGAMATARSAVMTNHRFSSSTNTEGLDPPQD